jgi:hypothetical protein
MAEFERFSTREVRESMLVFVDVGYRRCITRVCYISRRISFQGDLSVKSSALGWSLKLIRSQEMEDYDLSYMVR